MDDADHPSAGEAEPGVLGNLPTTRPQHRSARRAGTASAANHAAARIRSSDPTATPLAHRRAATEPPPPPATAGRQVRSTPVPDVPPLPPVPRSGWATPHPAEASTTPLPPLVALADGTVRAGARLLRGVLRRLPGN